MPRARRRHDEGPRGLTLGETAEYLGHALNWLTPAKLEELVAAGFPRPDPLTQRIDFWAINIWMSRRSGILVDAPEPSRPRSRLKGWREALHGDPVAVRRRQA